MQLLFERYQFQIYNYIYIILSNYTRTYTYKSLKYSIQYQFVVVIYTKLLAISQLIYIIHLQLVYSSLAINTQRQTVSNLNPFNKITKFISYKCPCFGTMFCMYLKCNLLRIIIVIDTILQRKLSQQLWILSRYNP